MIRMMTTPRCLALPALLVVGPALLGCHPTNDESNCWDSSTASVAASGSTVEIEGVALRGSFTAATLSASPVGQNWTTVATGLAGVFVPVTPSPSLQARYLQLQEATDEQGEQLYLAVSELSAW